MNLGIGVKHAVQCIVDINMTADKVGSGSMAIFSTPSLLALMECAAFELAQKGMDRGMTTVGGYIELRHTSPTPVGMSVVAEAKIAGVIDKKITFEICAFDKAGIIAEAKHTRYIVERKRFMRVADNKL